MIHGDAAGAFVLGGVLGGLAGYALRANNGIGPYAAGVMAAGGVTGYGEGCDIARANARIDNIIAQNAQDAVLGAIAGVNSNINSNAKELYQLNIQELFAQQQSAQALNDQFCSVNAAIMNDGIATRATINQFKDQYTQDRIADLAAENAALKSQLSIMPIAAQVGNIQNTLNSVIGCTGVKVCGCCPSGTVTF